jgi:hypothetical protein
MAVSKLSVMNDALSLLGDHRLATVTDDVEARYALDNSWDRAVAFVFQAAFWRFALKTASLVHNGGLTALAGYTSTFAQPAGFYRPHAVFVLSGARECPVDIRHQGVTFHANTTPIYLRYIDSTLVATPASWPELVAKAVAAYLAFDVSSRVSQDPQAPQQMFGLWQQYFGTAQAVEAVPPDPWLEHQLSGRFLRVLQGMLEEGYWRFAVKTVELEENAGPASSGYSYSFDRPADWLRTFEVYATANRDGNGIDFREEDEQYHAFYTPITVRYVSTLLGTDARNWPAAFEDALLAQLELRRALENPETPGAVLQSIAGLAEKKLKAARSLDDSRERPRVNIPSRFVSGRFGYGWGRSSREQG